MQLNTFILETGASTESRNILLLTIASTDNELKQLIKRLVSFKIILKMTMFVINLGWQRKPCL